MPIQETPFDLLLSDLMENQLGNPAFPNPPSLVGQKVITHLGLLRVIYLNFPRAGGEAEIKEKAREWASLSVELKNASMSDGIYTTNQTYFTFIDALNQAGRHLREIKFELPLYNRIRFFRNKVVEHWDDYLSIHPGGATQGMVNHILVPRICGVARYEVASMDAARIALCDALDKYNIVLSADDHDSDYANKIWPVLQQADNKIWFRCYKKKEGSCSPQCTNCTLVDALFKYEFPLPFHNVDAYCSGLVDEIRAKIFNYI